MATLTVTQSTDYSAEPLSNITEIRFDTVGQELTATFLGSQFDGNPIALNVRFTGFALGNNVVINGVAGLDASAWQFTSWETTDTITINGTKFANSFVCSNAEDTIFGGAGADSFTNIATGDRLNGGSSNDKFTIKPTVFGFGGTVIDGGDGFDTIVAENADAISFSFGIQNVEGLQFGTGTTTLDVRGSEFSAAGGITGITGNALANTLVVNGPGADLSLATFTSWTAGADQIVFRGFGNQAPGSATGSQLGDLFEMVGTSQAAPVFLQVDGQGGDDTIVFKEQISGFGSFPFELDGGAGSADTLLLQAKSSTAPYDLRQAAVTGIERLELTGTSFTAIMSANQLAGLTHVVLGTNGPDLEVRAIIGQSLDLGALTVTGGQNSQIVVVGTSQNDAMSGSAFNDRLQGDLGNDTLDGAAGADTVDGGLGDDTLNGGDGNDALLGGDGNDTLNGGADNDSADGGIGNDMFKGGIGADGYIGGDGQDTVDYRASDAAIALDFVTSFFSGGHAQGDTLSSIENVTGSVFADSISGGDAFNTFRGAGGADFLLGNNGRDTLLGEGGNDTLDGGTAFDKLTGGAGRDTLTGGGDSDFFIYTKLADSRVGAAADIITDFTQGQDEINLVTIDANQAGGTANDGFVFIGSDLFHGVAGEVRFEVVTGAGGTKTVISLDATGDGVADSQIKLLGGYTLLDGDFAL